MLTTLNIISLIASLLSLLACLWLFSSYLHVHPHRRSIALEMILILGISDFIQAIASAAIFITLEDFIPCQILQYVINFSTFFSLFWATALAVFSAVSFSQIMAFQNKARRFFYFALITSLLISALLPIPMLVNFSGTGYTSIAAKQFDICSHGYSGVATIKTKVINLLFIQFGPCFLAVCVTSFCYIKVAFALKTASVEVMDNWMINPKFLMWYPLGTMILYLPFLAAAVVYETEGTSDFCDYFWRICIRLCGFVNSVVYLTMRKRIKKSKLDTHSILPPNQGLNATLGNDQKITITEGFEIKTPNPQMG